jgi:hypothetical protein
MVVILPLRVTLLCPERCGYDPVGYHVVCSNLSLKSIPFIFPTNVQKLVLFSNSITSSEKDRFISSRLTELEEISVNDCEMEGVKLRAFSGLRELALLSVCGNKLCEITPYTFEEMNRLEYLVLVDNFIERLVVDLS